MRDIDVKLGGTTPLSIVIDAPKASASPKAAIKSATTDGFDDFDGSSSGDDGFGASSNGFDSPFASDAKPDPLADSYWFTPDHLALLVNIQHYLESIPANGKVLSLGTT